MQKKLYGGDLNSGRRDGGQVPILEEGQRGTKAMVASLFLPSPRRQKMEKQFEYTVNKEKEVCQKAWIFSRGLSYGRYKNYKNAVSSSEIAAKLLTSSL